MNGLIIFAAIALFLLASLLALRVTKGSNTAARKLSPDKTIDYRAKSLLSNNEGEIFARLLQALPGCLIFPKIALANLAEPIVAADAEDDEQSLALQAPATADIGRAEILFVIYDDRMFLVAAVLLEQTAWQQQKNAPIAAVLEQIGVPVFLLTSPTDVDALAKEVKHLVRKQKLTALL